MLSFIRRNSPQANELGLEFTHAENGVEAAILAPSAHGVPLRLDGMQPYLAITTARDLAIELGLNVAVIDKAGVWKGDADAPVQDTIVPIALPPEEITCIVTRLQPRLVEQSELAEEDWAATPEDAPAPRRVVGSADPWQA